MADLFSYEPSKNARRTDRATSKRAAKFLKPGTDCKIVFDVLTNHGPLADFQIPKFCALTEEAARKRRADLLREGLVCATDMQRHKPGGRVQTVWAISGTEAGRQRNFPL